MTSVLRDSAQLSTLPEWVRREYENAADHIDAQAAELAELREHCRQLSGDKFSDRNHAALKSRAETAERRCAELVGVLKESLAGWDHVVEELELNGYHDHPDFQYRRHKEWLREVETKADALTGD